jgi:hypothetical protein
MKNRFFTVLLLWSVCWGQIAFAGDTTPLPLPNSGNVTLTLDEYNKLMELAARPPKKLDVAPLPYSTAALQLKPRWFPDNPQPSGGQRGRWSRRSCRARYGFSPTPSRSCR